MVRKLAIATILLILPFFLTGCGLKKPKSSAVSPSPSLSAVPTGDQTATVVGENSYLGIEAATAESVMAQSISLADTKAKAWRANAALVHYSVRFASDLTVGAITETLSYGSPSEAYDWWTVTIAGKTGKAVRAVIPKEDYLGTSYTAIPRQHWKMNYVEALQLADTHGGSAYRAKHADSEITAVLSVSEPKNYLWWAVTYRSATADPLQILINPSTKEVMNASGEPITPSATPSSEATEPVIDESGSVVDQL